MSLVTVRPSSTAVAKSRVAWAFYKEEGSSVHVCACVHVCVLRDTDIYTKTSFTKRNQDRHENCLVPGVSFRNAETRA